MYPNIKSLASIIKGGLVKKNDQKSITFLTRGEVLSEQSLTGIEAHQKISKIANYIVNNRRNSKTYSPIIIAMSSGLDTILTINSCIYAGIVFIPIQIAKRENVYKKAVEIFKDCGVCEVIVDNLGEDFIEHLKVNYGLSKTIKSIVINNKEIEYTSQSNETLQGFSKNLKEHCFIQHTSGSTSKPKGIVINGMSVYNNSNQTKKTWNITENTVIGSWLPHYHDMGLVCLIYSLITSSSLIVMSPLAFVQKPIRWLKMISHYKVNLTGGPPFAYRLCMEYFKKNLDSTIDLSSLETIFCGAENVPKNLLIDFKYTFKNYGFPSNALFNCYGMAEVVSYISGSPTLEADLESSYVAPIFLNPETFDTIKIVNPKKNTIEEDGTEGEIWVQNDSIAVGYIKNSPTGTFTIDREGFNGRILDKKGEWLKTGDRGIIKGKYLYVLGRAKDLIISNGVNFSASEIEIIAASVNNILNPFGAVAFQKTEKGKTITTLLIEFSDSRFNIDSSEELKLSIKKIVLQSFAIDLNYIYLLKRGSLQRTSSGKIRRQYIATHFKILSYKDKILF